MKAVREISLSPGVKLSSVKEAGHAGASDVHWITKFAEEGGDAILSADKDFLKLEPQVNAVFDTGMKVIHLPPKWQNAPGHLQAAHILQWWKRIEQTVTSMRQRECYRPEWNITDRGEMKKVKIDFAKAQKTRRHSKNKGG